MIGTFRSALSFCLTLLCVMLLALAGCENPGSVGTGIGDSRADVVIDTIAVDNINTRNFNYYSGNFSYFSAGQYDDPLLGNITATGLIKPALPTVSDESVNEDAGMLMRLIFNNNQVYGDSLSDQTFDIYEVGEIWRSNAVRLQDDLQLDQANGPIGSFTVGSEDSVDIELPQEWVRKYRQYADTTNSDSLYSREVFGLALVPSNSNKIIAPNTADTRFVIQNPDADTFSVSTSEWGYLLERGNTGGLPQGSVAWHGTYEQLLSFGLDLSGIDVQGPDIAKAELVLYRNDELMQQSLQSEPISAGRPDESNARLYLVNPEDLPDNITPGTPIANGSYSSDDGAYHFRITGQLQTLLDGGFPEDQELVVTLVNDGIVKTSVMYDENAPADKRPKLIITSLKNNTN